MNFLFTILPHFCESKMVFLCTYQACWMLPRRLSAVEKLGMIVVHNFQIKLLLIVRCGGWGNCRCKPATLGVWKTYLGRYTSVPGFQGTRAFCHTSMCQKGRILAFLPLLQKQELWLNCFLLSTLVHHAVSELLMCHGLWKRGSSLLDLVFFC